MINLLVTLSIALSLFCWGSPKGNIFFSKQDVSLTEFKPIVHAQKLYRREEQVNLYIYAVKPFETDNLIISMVNLDNKGIYLPKTEVSQTMNIDVAPNDSAVKSKITPLKEGQFVVLVFRSNKPEKPFAQGELLVE